MQQVYFLGFRKTEGQELKDGSPTRHRFADSTHEGSFLGTREQPLTHAAGPHVDNGADIIEQFGGILDLVEDNRRSQLVKKCTRIVAYPTLNVGVFKQYVASFRKQLAEKGGFARTAGPCHNNRWEMPSCVQ